jgi:ABC-type lipoprotein release transport system permease subunit
MPDFKRIVRQHLPLLPMKRRREEKIIDELASALALARLLASMLYGVEPTDPFTLALVPIVLVAAAGLASLMPARRAMRIDPVAALRGDFH